MEQITLWNESLLKITPPTSVTDLWKNCPKSGEIQKSFMTCFDHLQDHEKVMCSISGGYDSDIMIDLMIRCGGKDKTTFVFNDTGLEYDATKEHIKYLEKHYGITIACLKPQKTIPICVREHGAPFWSKHVSEMISRLQRHGFHWEDGELEFLDTQYPKCRSALRWWCNDYKTTGEKPSRFNIDWTPGLKEFIIQNPPQFQISQQCCIYAKKKPIKDFLEVGDFDLNCMGVRKQEGGERASAYQSCFDEVIAGPDNYRPLFWWSDQDKELYRKYYGIVRSDCYEEWGMERTGCAGCPFGKNLEQELELVQLFEPKRYRAMLAIFGQSYEYTREFLEFREKRKIEKTRYNLDQIVMSCWWCRA